MNRDQEIVALKNQIRELHDKNRELNRRVSARESPWQKERDKESALKNMWSDNWMRQFDRTSRTFNLMKEIYEICAPILGYPYGAYHAVNDCSHNLPNERPMVWVGVIHNNQVQKYRIIDVVRDTIEQLQTNNGAKDE